LEAWWHGPFGFQANSSTRVVEYPWAFYVATVKPGVRVLEVGGGLAGFQFVLARSGASVVNVDPFLDYGAGRYPDQQRATHAALNRSFRTDVELCVARLTDTALAAESVDRVYCLSTIEHLGADEARVVMAETRRLLCPGGLVVLTIDLFLNLQPFTARRRNEWGENVSVADLIACSQMDLVYGDEQELCGGPRFDPERILANLERYLIGETYPVLVQLLVLRKRGGPAKDDLNANLWPADEGERERRR
jgi:hypothetical protein